MIEGQRREGCARDAPGMRQGCAKETFLWRKVSLDPSKEPKRILDEATVARPHSVSAEKNTSVACPKTIDLFTIFWYYISIIKEKMSERIN